MESFIIQSNNFLSFCNPNLQADIAHFPITCAKFDISR